MNLQLIQTIYNNIIAIKDYNKILEFKDFEPESCNGSIQYNKDIIDLSNCPSWYSDGLVKIHDEEMVRAWLVISLYFHYGYNQKKIIAIEKEYKSVGRDGKGGRVDVLVHNKDKKSEFLFVECKAPDRYDEEIAQIDGQLFRLSRQEVERPNFLLYYTVKLQGDSLFDRVILIDANKYQTYEQWKDSGADAFNAIPRLYGVASKKLYANIETPTNEFNILDQYVEDWTFKQLNREIHDVIWAGGGTSNNEIFVYIVKLLLCKIYDEQETDDGCVFQFQRKTDETGEVETSDATFNRMNDIYKAAEAEYLALKENSSGPGFDKSKISTGKIAYVVGKLEGISLIKNKYSGDMLGDFFENIVSQDFTQSRGQFFTPTKLIRFMIALANCTKIAESIIVKDRDEQGRYRLPYIIDPSCGTGAFLIEYMKQITSSLGNPSFLKGKNNKIKENCSIWFGGDKHTNWAKEYLFAIENNPDLGLAAKVNMVLHGDGCTNTWIENGLFPFSCYSRDKATNILGSSKIVDSIDYSSPINGGFDIILSNPPFSIKNNEDDERKISEAFSDTFKLSEILFLERWFQLLREGGIFCCVLPENILDTNTSLSARHFLLKNFSIKAIISLPYDAFKPFTSVKTCVVLAEKKSYKEIREWEKIYNNYFTKYKDDNKAFIETARKIDSKLNHRIFMAEPQNIGYKRRRNLPDLLKENELYKEMKDGRVSNATPDNPTTVLDHYFRPYAPEDKPNLRLGFYVSITDVANRSSLRLDPKYNWLWVINKGIVAINESTTHLLTLSELIEVIKLPKVTKSQLEAEKELIDLDAVKPRTGRVDSSQAVIEIGSDKEEFRGTDILFSKLEPYLGKVIIRPPQDAIGSTEWVGLTVKKSYDPNVVGFLLMHHRLCESYRMLQSGKRHARLDPNELLELTIKVDQNSFSKSVLDAIEQKEARIKRLNDEIEELRGEIDSIFER